MHSRRIIMTMVCAVFIIALAVAFGLTGSRLWSVYAEDTAPSPEFIAAAMRNQEQPGMALVTTYTLERSEIFSEKTRAEIKTVRDMYYVRTLEAMYLKEKVTNTAAAEADTSDIDITNYTVERSYNRTSGEYRELTERDNGAPASGIDTRKPELNALGLMTPVESVVGYFGSASLYYLVEHGTVLDKKEIDGHDCWGVAYDVSGVLQRHVVWVDPDIGFCPRRIELILNNQLRHCKSLCDYHKIGENVWFPKEIMYERFSKTGESVTSSTIKVTDIKLIPLEPDIKLRVHFPPGTSVEK